MDFQVIDQQKALEKKPNQPSTQDIPLERQRKNLMKMEKALEELRERIETYKQKAAEKQATIKELVSQQKKKEAQGQLQVLKVIKAEIDKQESLYVILEKTKIELEASANIFPVVDALKEAVILQKEAEKNKEYLEDIVSEQKEMDEQNKEISSILRESAAVNEQAKDEIDELYKEFEIVVLDEEINDINKDPLKNVIKPQAQIHTQPAQVNTNTQAKQKEDKELDDLLEKAAMYN